LKAAAEIKQYLPLTENRMMRLTFSLLMLAANAAVPVLAQAPVTDVKAARASLTGNWEGRLEYLDYSANEWFGIPVKTRIEDQGDGATMIRKSDFDDGPVTGMVRITSVELFDPAASTVSTGTFRKGRTAEIMTYKVRMEGLAKDAAHWTMIEETTATDNKRPAMLRLTTTRNGDQLETLKEVDFQDDDKVEWMSRNRTRLTQVGG
jgi:hypothetical protein